MSDTVFIDLTTLATNSETTVNLDIALDALDGLSIEYNGRVLPDAESLEVLVMKGQVFHFAIADFEQPKETFWTVSASPRIYDASQVWTRGDRKATECGTYEWPHPGFLWVTIEAQAKGEQPRKKKIQIKIQPERPMPPTRGFKRG